MRLPGPAFLCFLAPKLAGRLPHLLAHFAKAIASRSAPRALLTRPALARLARPSRLSAAVAPPGLRLLVALLTALLLAVLLLALWRLARRGALTALGPLLTGGLPRQFLGPLAQLGLFARQCFERALGSSAAATAQRAAFWLNKGKALFMLGRYQLARDALVRSYQLDSSPESAAGIAACRERMGDLAPAEAAH